MCVCDNAENITTLARIVVYENSYGLKVTLECENDFSSSSSCASILNWTVNAPNITVILMTKAVHFIYAAFSTIL